MTTPRVRSAHRKPARTARLDRGNLHLFEDGEKVISYALTPLPCDLPGCSAFRLEKFSEYLVSLQDASYDVLVNPTKPAESTCECKGFLRWGHCRHIESLTALHRAGRLS